MAVPYKLNYFEIETGIDSTSTFIHTGDLTATKVKKYLATSNDILLGDGTTTSLSGLQPTGNYITALTGEATATGPGSVAITLTNSAVIGKVLTGLSITGSTIAATDTILQAFGKVQNQINGKQATITLTTTGTSGAATFISNVLNIPQYTDAFVGTVTSVAALTLGTTGTDLSSTVANSTTTPVITLNVPTASAANRGALSAADWTTFNSKQDAITLTTTGSSGASTFISNTLNVPTYTLSGLGGVPTTRQLTINGTAYDLSADRSWSVGTVTSVGITMPAAFSIANSPVTSAGTIAITGAGLASQYIRGDGALGDFPNTGGGGSSVSYYLNGSINQGTFVGNTYYEMNKTPVIGAGTDFTINADGYIAQFITDANDPASLLIPGGNWNVEMYFSASSSGGTPSFYVEVYKYDGTTFTLLGSSSATPEGITNGTAIDIYYTSVGIPETVLTITDRIAIRVYVTHSGRTITLHTEDNHLSEIVTTFSNGLTALNGLTKQVQFLAVGTSGTDFNISSSVDTHTFNIPDASATARGLINIGSQTIGGDKILTSASSNPTLSLRNTGAGRKFEIKDSGGGNILYVDYIGQTYILGNLTIGGGNTFDMGQTMLATGASYFASSLSVTRTLSTNSYYIAFRTGATQVTATPNWYAGNFTGNNDFEISKYDGSSVVNTLKINSTTNLVTLLGGISATTANFTGQLTLGSTITNGTYTYTLPSATGTLALTSALSAYVPYTGATGDVDLGTNNGITLTDTGSNTSINVTSSSTGQGAILVTKSGNGEGIRVLNGGIGSGFLSANTSTGIGFYINNSSTGIGLKINNDTSATGDPFIYTLNNVSKAKIDYLGNITGVAGTFTGQLSLGSTITNGTYTYTLPSATGTLALTSALTGYVPYTGATQTLALGTNNGITLTDTSTNVSISITSSSIGSGAIYVDKSGAGTGIQVANNGTGFGFYANNISTGYGIAIGNASTGKGLYIDNAAAATGDPFVYTLGGAAFVKAKIDYLGNITGVAASLTGALSGTSATFSSDLSALGNLGIGTATPETFVGYKTAEISSTAGGVVFAKSTTGTITTQLVADNAVSGGYVGTRTNHVFSIRTNNTDRLTIASTGAATFSTSLVVGAASNGRLGVRGTTSDSSAYAFEAANSAGGTLFIVRNDGAATFSSSVGIGLSPTYTLDIQTTTPILRIRNITAPATGGTSSLLFEGINNFSGVSQSFINSIQAGNSGATQLVFGTSGTSDATATERMRITSGGDVYIGDTTSIYSTRLHVKSTVNRVTALTTTQTTGAAIEYFANTSTLVGYLGNGSFLTTGAAATDFILRSENALAFNTNGNNERMRITSDGQVLIGKQTKSTRLAGPTVEAEGTFYSGGSQAGYFFEDRANATYWYGWYSAGNTNVFFYNGNSGANIASITPSTGVYTPLSDINKKKDFEDSTIGLNEVLQLKPTLYRMKSDDTEGNKELGFIAQDVQPFIPQAYVESGEEKDKFIGLNYNAIVAALVKGMQEQQAQIEELKSLINK